MRLSVLLLASCALPFPAVAGVDAEVVPPEDEVVVTGTREASAGTGSKTGTPARDVPASIVQIPGAILRAQDVRSLDEALANASAVAPNFAGGYGVADNYLVRGLPMRFLRDGLPDGPSFMGYRRTLSDVAQIEVLKGPGSALYGRAEAGGSVNVVTRGPLAERGVDGQTAIGSFGARRVLADLGGAPFGDVETRLIYAHERSADYRGLGRRTTDILPSLALDLGADHRLTLDYDRRESRATVDNYGIPFTVEGTLASIDPRSRLYSAFNRADQRVQRFTVTDSLRVHPDVSLRAAAVHDRREVDVARNAGANLVSAAGVITGRNGRTQSDDARYTTGQLEMVATPTTGPVGHTVLLGVEYARADVDTVRRNYALPSLSVADGGRVLSVDEPTAIAASTPGFDRAITTDTWSVYAQEQVDFGAALKVRVGGRLDRVRLVDEGKFGTTDARIAGTSNLFSWQAGAVWRPVRALSLYGGYSRGQFLNIQTESANLSPNFAARAAPEPESSSQIEGGVKTEFLDGRLNANLALFRTTRDDFFVALAPGADPVQVGKQRSRGVELDVVGTPVDGFSLIGNLAYVDARNRSTALASVAGIASNQSTFDKRLGSTPRFSGALWGQVDVGATGFRVGAGVVHKGAVYADALELLRVPAYTLARAALTYRTGRYEAQLTVNNLFDTRYYEVPTFIGALPGTPRAAQFTLRAGI